MDPVTPPQSPAHNGTLTSPPPSPPAGGRGECGSAGSAALSCTSPRPSRRTSHVAFADLPPDPDDPLLGFAPYLHKAPRRNSITPDRQRAFIACLAATGIVTQAARRIGASLEALYRLRHQPGAEQFSAAWEQAIDRGIARLEDCALERAIEGEERFHVRDGQVLARWIKYDTALLRFLLQQRRTARWNAELAAYAALKPGHPVYDRLRTEWAGEDQQSHQEVLDSIDRMIDDMRNRSLANTPLIESWDEEDEDEDADGADGAEEA
ncbi:MULTISPECIES: hypothetical protein [unclassified Novosphingobium]|uniref:hypothetical protein n=1 Tax=unclassified Novosphingobium TaxID=2644732 RepID=UPI000EE4DFA9|nr:MULTISPECIES: hypothetical protein [unclassified Novosphingobium]HCF24413.1 hypothetical protein [Novosphingobium sp.]HQV05007.1 hypothetical protein [Novosphingobium sp.]